VTAADSAPRQPHAIAHRVRRGARRLTAPVRRRLGWFVWGTGAGVYVLAVFHRTSLGVAGPLAEQRFSLNAAQLGTFVTLQLGVYALMQVPTGIMVDRFGPRRMLIAATTTMGIAQIGFALVQTYPLALLARGLLGCGDAMTYISVLRLVAAWFPARRYAVLTAVTGLLGSVGNLVATLPLTVLLTHFGWTATFIVAGSLSLGYVVLLLRPAIRQPAEDTPQRAAGGRVAGHRVWAELRQAWKVPAGRLGFWVHLTTMTGPTVFSVLWGFPYLTEGLRYPENTASTLLLLMVFVGIVASLAIGVIVSRRPVVRTPVAVGVALSCLIAWLGLIGWPGGRPPSAVVIVAIVLLAVGGPTSTVGFFLARDYNPRHRISTATGMVNVGGFAGSVIGVYVVGQILDLVDANQAHHTLTAFRWAFAAMAALTAVGLTRMVTWWLRTRAEVLLATARGEQVPVHITAHRWELVDTVLLAKEAERARSLAANGGADGNGDAGADTGTSDSAEDSADDSADGSAQPLTAAGHGAAVPAPPADPAHPVRPAAGEETAT
jgi:MFS family permease